MKVLKNCLTVLAFLLVITAIVALAGFGLCVGYLRQGP